MNVKIKICGLTRPEDVDYVNEARPDFCGFVINVPKSIRNNSPQNVKMLLKGLSPDIIPVAVFRNEEACKVADICLELGLKYIQLHGKEDEDYIGYLRGRGDFTIIKAFNEKNMDQAMDSSADMILLDNGDGGTGECFSWEKSRQIGRPFFLAGGLGRDNLEEAILTVKPWAVDLSSKLETQGRKDREKILETVQIVRQCRI